MIYTCTLNPAIDYIMNLSVLESNKINHIKHAFFRAGGKGINVSVVLHNLGINSVALGFIGDFTGSFIKNDLKEYTRIKLDFIDIPGRTRMNIKINHGNKETDVNDRGPKVSNQDFNKLLNQIDQLTENDLLICSGSTCQGQPAAYQKIAKICDKRNIKFIMDVPGKEILDFIDYKPFLIKPNLEELEDYFDIKIGSMKELIDYGKRLVDMGASNVLVSMGSKGSILLDKDHIYRANKIHGQVVNTTGAGDSMIAGFVNSYIQYEDIKKAYLYAVSAGTATVFGEGLATKDTCNMYQDKIKIKEIHS